MKSSCSSQTCRLPGEVHLHSYNLQTSQFTHFRRFRVATTRLLLIRKHSTKIPGDGDNIPIPENLQDKEKPKINDATERINQLLQSMMEYKSKQQSSERSIISENDGFKRSKFAKPPPKDEVESIKEAASAVAQSLGENVAKTEEELLEKALEYKKFSENVDWNVLIEGMTVDKSTSSGETVPDKSRSQQVRYAMHQSKGRSKNDSVLSITDQVSSRRSNIKMSVKKIPLFNGEPLNIFKTDTKRNEGTDLGTWKALEENDLRLAITHPPTNYFQKMILWTNQGKVWKFPIDNEQGMEAEQAVHFSEHIFLENHLEGWCPQKGPIRHFMELVCVGLSKNHYFSAQDKRDHIVWFKNYFESKKTLLQEVGAYKMDKEVTAQSSPS